MALRCASRTAIGRACLAARMKLGDKDSPTEMVACCWAAVLAAGTILLDALSNRLLQNSAWTFCWAEVVISLAAFFQYNFLLSAIRFNSPCSIFFHLAMKIGNWVDQIRFATVRASGCMLSAVILAVEAYAARAASLVATGAEYSSAAFCQSAKRNFFNVLIKPRACSLQYGGRVSSLLSFLQYSTAFRMTKFVVARYDRRVACADNLLEASRPWISPMSVARRFRTFRTLGFCLATKAATACLIAPLVQVAMALSRIGTCLVLLLLGVAASNIRSARARLSTTSWGAAWLSSVSFGMACCILSMTSLLETVGAPLRASVCSSAPLRMAFMLPVCWDMGSASTSLRKAFANSLAAPLVGIPASSSKSCS
mmetsp:Transcript_16565/g.36634  ORF Transcript_16565/g.36634 Transcript_16565/m.36634 type:complete len:369 (+) Transcript_16565:250-1356(+)